MKIKLLFTGLVAIFIVACGQSQTQQKGYTISGEIAGLSGKVYLTVFEGKMPQRIDSTEANNGTFSFKGNQALPIFAAIETESGPLLRFFLENSPITIHGSANDPEAINVLGSTS